MHLHHLLERVAIALKKEALGQFTSGDIPLLKPFKVLFVFPSLTNFTVKTIKQIANLETGYMLT